MSAAIMAPSSTSTLTPNRPSGLSRSTATYYSESSLPRSSLDSWSLDHSCTTFGTAFAAAGTTTTLPQHRRPSILIESDPDINEEEHMRGIKRDRHSMTKSPATKRRCYPLGLLGASSSCEASSSEAARVLLSSSTSSLNGCHRTISLSGTSNHDGNASYNSDKSFGCETNHDDDDDDDDIPMPAPPSFRRRSTIKDPFDLACSIEEFKHLI